MKNPSSTALPGPIQARQCRFSAGYDPGRAVAEGFLLSDEDAVTVSEIIAKGGVLPAVKKEFIGHLFHYYKTLLYRDPKQRLCFSVPRRWPVGGV